MQLEAIEILANEKATKGNKKKLHLNIFHNSFSDTIQHLDNKLYLISKRYESSIASSLYILPDEYNTSIQIMDYFSQKGITIETPKYNLSNIHLLSKQTEIKNGYCESTITKQSLYDIYTLCKMSNFEDKKINNTISHRYIIPNYTSLSRVYLDNTYDGLYMKLVIEFKENQEC